MGQIYCVYCTQLLRKTVFHMYVNAPVKLCVCFCEIVHVGGFTGAQAHIYLFESGGIPQWLSVW